MSKVSIIIPTCNRPELLKRSIASVLAQTFQDFEIIVIDDGNGEGYDVVSSFSDRRINYIKNQEKKGAAGARNIGIYNAHSPFIAFLDDDDEWLAHKLEIQIGFLDSSPEDVGFCFSAVRNTYNDHTDISQVEDGVHDYQKTAITRFSGFLTSTLVVKKNVFEKTGVFDPSFPSHQEPDLIIRITRHYKGIGINKPLVNMNMSDREHIGGRLDRRIAGRKLIIKKHFDIFIKHPDVLAKHYFRIGLWNRDSGNFREAKEYFRKAMSASFSIRYFFHYASMCFGAILYKKLLRINILKYVENNF